MKTKVISIEYWSVNDNIPKEHIRILDQIALEKIAELINEGHSSGQIHDVVGHDNYTIKWKTHEQKNNFPNGFESWMETHHEIVSAMTQELLSWNNIPDDKRKSKIMSRLYYEQGTGAMYELAQELTDEFEKEYQGVEWDGEFFDEIEKFIEQKLYSDER